MTTARTQRLLTIGLACAAFSFAQSQGSSGGGSSSGGSSGGSSSSRGSNSGSSESAPPAPTPLRRSYTLRGQVKLHDGTPPPAGTFVTGQCGGQPVSSSTDSKGRFTVRFGEEDRGSLRNRRILLGGPTECALSARLHGYRSTKVYGRASGGIRGSGTVGVVLHPLEKIQGSTVSIVSLQAPTAAKKALKDGRKAAKKKRWEKARAALDKAIELYPEYAEAWNALGDVHGAEERIDSARLAYTRATELDPNFLTPFVNLALLDARAQDWGKVIERTGYVTRMNPFDSPEAFFYNAVANFKLRNLPEAEASAREVVAMDQRRRFPQAIHLLGMALAQQGKLDEASQWLEEYLELAPKAPDADRVRQALAEIDGLLRTGERPQAQQFARAGPE